MQNITITLNIKMLQKRHAWLPLIWMMALVPIRPVTTTSSVANTIAAEPHNKIIKSKILTLTGVLFQIETICFLIYAVFPMAYKV
jgi:hypothetical protein